MTPVEATTTSSGLMPTDHRPGDSVLQVLFRHREGRPLDEIGRVDRGGSRVPVAEDQRQVPFGPAFADAAVDPVRRKALRGANAALDHFDITHVVISFSREDERLGLVPSRHKIHALDRRPGGAFAQVVVKGGERHPLVVPENGHFH